MADRARRVGIIVHGGRPEALAAAHDATEHLRAAGLDVVACRGDAWADAGVDGVDLRSTEEFARDLDLVLVLGGDGTFLRAAHLVRDEKVPLLGVNLGRLGFLADLEETELIAAIPTIAEGRWEVEERMTLSVAILDAEGSTVASGWALNEASVERIDTRRLIILDVHVGATRFATIPADALVLATPTGSTAYAFSAGGPVLSPLVDAIVLTPVAPHSLFSRTVVIDPAEELSVRPQPGGNACVVGLDGRETFNVPDGGAVLVSRGEIPVLLAHVGPVDFYARVRDKFNLYPG